MTHILDYRLDIRRGDDCNASVAFCGYVAPDVAPLVLFPDRNREIMRQGMGGLVADVRAFAPDDKATCPLCRQAREGVRPGRLLRLWRWVTRTAPAIEPAPDLIAEVADEARHPDDGGVA